MIIKEPYNFNDGRIGIKSYSNKFYKTIEVEEAHDENGELIFKKLPKDIYYNIRKVGTDEVYDEAIDILSFEYEEVSLEEMEAKYDSNK